MYLSNDGEANPHCQSITFRASMLPLATHTHTFAQEEGLRDLCKTETEVRSTKPKLLHCPPRVLGCSCYPPHCSSLRPSVQSIGSCLIGNPGGERCGKTCLEERDNQWLGVSLSRQPKESGSIIVCINHWICMSLSDCSHLSYASMSNAVSVLYP